MSLSSSDARDKATMRPEFYEQVFSVQTSHWWGRNRRKLAFDLLTRYGLREGCQHLDIGCGTGQNLGLLNALKPSRIVGVDISPIAINFAREAWPRCEFVQCDINRELPFAEKTFDVVTIFNVLYHAWVESDLRVLKDVRRVLKPGGILLITEPAFPALARQIDGLVMTKRRYRLPPFMEMLQAAEFDLLLSSYFTSFGAPLILASNAANRLARKRATVDAPDMRPMNPVLNAAFYGLARIEAGLLKASIPMPFGTTILCVGRRH
jgi:SAM-dependent methyltransferase